MGSFPLGQPSPAPCPPAPVCPSLATVLGRELLLQKAKLILQPLPEPQGHTVAVKPVRKCCLLASFPWEHTSPGSHSAGIVGPPTSA